MSHIKTFTASNATLMVEIVLSKPSLKNVGSNENGRSIPLASVAASSLATVRTRLDRLLSEYEHAKRQVGEEARTLEKSRERVADVLEAQKLVQGVAEAVQHQAHQRIASVVSRCLETVFGDDAYEFRINFEQKRGKTEARLLFVRDGVEMDPTDACGGGVVDLAATSLRLACLILSRPQRRRLLVLDEPWKHLSAEYRPAMRELVVALSKEMGIQFIIVTHSSEFRIGKVVELG